MQYEIKLNINGVTVYAEQEQTKVDGVVYSAPSITNVKLQNNATTGTMEIGAAASDCLTFTLLNPFTQSFDGQTVEFYIKPVDNLDTDTKGQIEEAVATGTAIAPISTVTNNTNVEIEEEEGDPITAEELADVEAVEAANAEATYKQLEGETDTTTPADRTETEWHKVGVYYVQKQETSADGSQVTLTCYDGFSKMNDIWTPTNTSGTVQTLFNDLKAKTLANCGITIEAFEFDTVTNITITWNTAASYRTALGYFAGLVGGFAAFDEEGNAAINLYTFTDNVLIKSDLMAYAEDSAGEMLITEISCNTALSSQEENIITAGAGQGLTFNNPYVTQGILNAILDDYTGTRLIGGALRCKWHEGLIAGEFVKVYEADEYANYLELKNAYAAGDTSVKDSIGSLGAVMLISSQVITFNGEAVTTITSGSEGEYLKANQMAAPTIRKIIEAGKTATNYITEEADGALVIRRDTDDYSVRIDADSLDIRKKVIGRDVTVASFGETVTIGRYFPLTISENEGISLASGKLHLPSAESISIDHGLNTYNIGSLPIKSGVSSNLWVWTVYSDSSLIAKCIDTYTPTGTNSQFASGLYYKDTTKTLAPLYSSLEENGFYYFDSWAASGAIHVNAFTNGNTGSGYINIWKSSYDSGTNKLNTRLVSNSASNMGTVTISYTVTINIDFLELGGE